MKNKFITLALAAFTFADIESSKAQWIQENSGVTGNLSDVVMLDTSTAIVAVHNGSILRTTNAGTTWFDVSLLMSYIGLWNAVSFFDTSCGVLVGDNRAAFWTFNGGKGWTWVQIPDPRNCLCIENCLSVLCTGPGSCHVSTDSGIVYSTSDTGKTWTFEIISHWPIRALFNYRVPVVGVSMFALTPYSLCTKYVIPPPSWGESILLPFRGLGSEGFDAEYSNGGGPGFIVGVQGDLRSAPTILRRSMFDTAWQAVGTGIAREGSFLHVSAPSANVVYACGTGGMMYKSSDGGDTWREQATQTTKNLNAVYFYDEKHGFAVGDSGQILYTSSGGLTSMSERRDFTPSDFSLDQNYPNPFNPTTVISYQLSAVSHVNLRVYDVLGREVKTLVNEVRTAGRYQVQFDASQLASGIYFYRITAGGNVSMKKMILMK